MTEDEEKDISERYGQLGRAYGYDVGAPGENAQTIPISMLGAKLAMHQLGRYDRSVLRRSGRGGFIRLEKLSPRDFLDIPDIQTEPALPKNRKWYQRFDRKKRF